MIESKKIFNEITESENLYLSLTNFFQYYLKVKNFSLSFRNLKVIEKPKSETKLSGSLQKSKSK